MACTNAVQNLKREDTWSALKSTSSSEVRDGWMNEGWSGGWMGE